jgi:hypothetical protein
LMSRSEKTGNTGDDGEVYVVATPPHRQEISFAS